MIIIVYNKSRHGQILIIMKEYNSNPMHALNETWKVLKLSASSVSNISSVFVGVYVDATRQELIVLYMCKVLLAVHELIILCMCAFLMCRDFISFLLSYRIDCAIFRSTHFRPIAVGPQLFFTASASREVEETADSADLAEHVIAFRSLRNGPGQPHHGGLRRRKPAMQGN